VDPSVGFSLRDQFTITVDCTSSKQLLYEFYVYPTKEMMNDDKIRYVGTNGFLLGHSTDGSLSTQLPQGVTLDKTVFLLIKVIDTVGAISFSNTTVIVKSLGYTVRDALEQVIGLMKKNETISRLAMYLRQIELLENYACYKDCQGYGQCESQESQ
jgi:hypothetical protein